VPIDLQREKYQKSLKMDKIAEYEALRATIRERGTTRMCLILAGLIAWAALILALNAAQFERAATLVPLMVVAATFEISFFIHTGVERVGRYLQVFYDDQWENIVMAYGKNNPGGGTHPLLITLFALIALVNFAASLPTAVRHPGWVGVSFVAHVMFTWRLVSARRMAAAQRALDLDRFRALKNPAPSN
jgi:hypothetical protein